jgi:arginine deiminase
MLNFLIQTWLCDISNDGFSENVVVDVNGSVWKYSLNGFAKSAISLNEFDFRNRFVLMNTPIRSSSHKKLLVDMFRRGMRPVDVCPHFLESNETVLNEGGDVFIVDVEKLFVVFKERWETFISRFKVSVDSIEDLLMEITNDGEEEFDKIIIIEGMKMNVTTQFDYS